MEWQVDEREQKELENDLSDLEENRKKQIEWMQKNNMRGKEK